MKYDQRFDMVMKMDFDIFAKDHPQEGHIIQSGSEYFIPTCPVNMILYKGKPNVNSLDFTFTF